MIPNRHILIVTSTTIALLLFFIQDSSGLESATTPLVRHVLSTPGLNLIPIKAQGDVLQVSLVVSVQSVDRVDREKNQIEASLFTSTLWTSGISWRPEDFNGLSRLVVFKSQIWTPDVVIVNAASGLDIFNPPNVILMNNGFAVMNRHFKVVLDCDVVSAESDGSRCGAKFQSDSFPNGFIQLSGPEYLPFDLSLFHAEWANTGGRYRARDGSYEKSQHSLFEDGRVTFDVVTYSFSIKDTRPHYRRQPSKLMVAWN